MACWLSVMSSCRAAAVGSAAWLAVTSGLAYASPSPIEHLDCDAAEQYSNTHSGLAVLVEIDGKRICATGRELALPHELYSGTKSFVGLMAAAAVQDGLMVLDERASDTLTEWRSDSMKKDATIRDLLSMSAGLPSEVGRPPTYQGAVAMPFNAAPGARFQYGPAPMQAFGEVLRRKLMARGLDHDPLQYLQRRLLGPIGLHYAQWREDAAGDPLMPQGAVLSAEEWAKVGRLILDHGRVAGKTIVDPGAFDALFVSSRTNASYGLTWWLAQGPPHPDKITASIDIGAHAEQLPADLVVAAGAGDQRLYVIPSQKLLIVRMAKLDVQAFFAHAAPVDRAARWSDTEFLHILLGTPERARW